MKILTVTENQLEETLTNYHVLSVSAQQGIIAKVKRADRKNRILFKDPIETDSHDDLVRRVQRKYPDKPIKWLDQYLRAIDAY